MQYTREIFDTLSKGAFISADSTSQQVRRWYDALDDGFQEYRAYYEGVGFILESGDGYFYFSRKESKADLQRKLEALLRWAAALDPRRYDAMHRHYMNQPNDPPQLIAVRKKAD